MSNPQNSLGTGGDTQREGVAVLPGLRAAAGHYTGKGLVDFTVKLFRKKPLGAFGLVIVVSLLLIALLADLIAPFHWGKTDLLGTLQTPNREHLLGTDFLGRDMLSRMVYGARISVYVGTGAVAISCLITLSLGMLSAWYGGRVDTFLQRGIVDVWIALPHLLILLTLSAMFGTGLVQMIFILALGGFGSSRVIRGTVLSLKAQPFVDGARAIGASTPRIFRLYLLPNIAAPMLVLATAKFGTIILAEAGLAFLGYGVPPPYPTWGRMLSGETLTFVYSAPWLILWPGIAITLVVFGWNVLGDALRDLLDPRMRGSS